MVTAYPEKAALRQSSAHVFTLNPGNDFSFYHPDHGSTEGDVR